MDVEGSEQNFTVHLQEGAVEPLNQVLSRTELNVPPEM